LILARLEGADHVFWALDIDVVDPPSRLARVPATREA